jgi:hypothetical protein
MYPIQKLVCWALLALNAVSAAMVARDTGITGHSDAPQNNDIALNPNENSKNHHTPPLNENTDDRAPPHPPQPPLIIDDDDPLSCWLSKNLTDVRIVTADNKTIVARLKPWGRFLTVPNNKLKNVNQTNYTTQFTMKSEVGGKVLANYLYILKK